MKNKKGIIILIIISVIGIGGFYLYDYIKRKLAINKIKINNIISNIKSSISKISKKPSYKSNSRIF